MKRLYGKLIGFGLVFAVITASAVLISGCEKKEADASTSVTSTTSAVETDGSDATGPLYVAKPSALEDMYDPELVALLNRSFSIDGKEISAGEYNYQCISVYQEFSTYAQYGYYPANEAGLLDLSATCDLTENGSGTWGDYLVQYAEEEIQRNYIMGALAEENGMAISAETQQSIESSMEQIDTQATSLGMTGDGYIEQYCGDKMTLERFKKMIQTFYLADLYATEFVENYTFSEEETVLPIVRHILYGAPRNGLREQDATEEEIATALANAESTLEAVEDYDDMVLIGDKHTRDQTALESAEYTVSRGEMVEEFEQWCFDSAREIGDKEIVRTDFGFHVMFFVGTTEATEEQMKVIAQNALYEMIDEKAKDEQYALTEKQ
ncbi:MAG: peptidylprolyl isomerase [Clostridiales bacterium]|nr:peptidylprolyl isomerase [Clostridiales bacterium]